MAVGLGAVNELDVRLVENNPVTSEGGTGLLVLTWVRVQGISLRGIPLGGPPNASFSCLFVGSGLGDLGSEGLSNLRAF